MDGTRGPLEPDPYSFGFRNEVGIPGYEGILHVETLVDRDPHWWLEFQPVFAPPALSIRRNSGTISVRVGQNWSIFANLHQSPDLKTWTRSTEQRLDFIYTNRVFQFPDTNRTGLFFQVREDSR